MIGDVAWYGSNSSSHTWEVGLKNTNDIGLYDMSGNVWEWCWDYYNDAAIDSSTPVTGPTTSSSSNFIRLMRGSSWANNASVSVVSYQFSDSPYTKFNRYGFRLACSE